MAEREFVDYLLKNARPDSRARERELVSTRQPCVNGKKKAEFEAVTLVRFVAATPGQWCLRTARFGPIDTVRRAECAANVTMVLKRAHNRRRVLVRIF